MAKKKVKIGVCDSGIGGLSILRELIKVPYDQELFYLADEAFAPYGAKDPETIKKRCHFLAQGLIEQEVDLIVFACNTATAYGIEDLRAQYHVPFVGIEPFLNVKAKKHFEEGERLGVITTVSMGKSERFKRLKEKYDPDNKIEHILLSSLASLVEEYFKGPNEDWQERFSQELLPVKKRDFNYLILGCTHYPLLKKEIERELGLECLSPCPYVAQRTYHLLAEQLNALEQPIQEFWFKSTLSPNWEKRSYDALWPSKR